MIIPVGYSIEAICYPDAACIRIGDDVFGTVCTAATLDSAWDGLRHRLEHRGMECHEHDIFAFGLIKDAFTRFTEKETIVRVELIAERFFETTVFDQYDSVIAQEKVIR